MPAVSFPAHVTAEIEIGSDVQEYAVSTAAGETAAKAGELMYYDTATQTLKRCGADPALIAGIFEAGDSAVARLLTPDNKVPIRLLSAKCVVRMGSQVTPAETHVGVAYGIVRDASGNWLVDTTDTVNTRVLVQRVDAAAGAFFVRFLPANLQFDAVVS